MTFANEGVWDRGVRMLGGAALVGIGWSGALPAAGLVAIAAGLVALTTGIVGWCPAYTVLGVSTKRAAVARCPHCEAGHHMS